jgi:excisionase family DNA binding protein
MLAVQNLDSSNQDFLTAPEAAKFLRLKVGMIYHLTSRRRIPFFKPGKGRILFRRDDLLAFIESGRISAKGQR